MHLNFWSFDSGSPAGYVYILAVILMLYLFGGLADTDRQVC